MRFNLTFWVWSNMQLVALPELLVTHLRFISQTIQNAPERSVGY